MTSFGTDSWHLMNPAIDPLYSDYDGVEGIQWPFSRLSSIFMIFLISAIIGK